MADAAQLRIDIWSDYVCPFCYLELPVIDRLQQAYGTTLEVRWRAFELRPEPVPTLDPAGDYLRNTWARVVYPMAAERGMTLHLPPVQPRSRKALELAAYARAQGRFDAVHRALLRAFFEEGRDIGDVEVLLDLAAAQGLDRASVQQALTEGLYTDEVLEDLRLAHALSVSAVPTLLLRQAAGGWHTAVPLSGALPYDHIAAVIEKRLRGGTAAD